MSDVSGAIDLRDAVVAAAVLDVLQAPVETRAIAPPLPSALPAHLPALDGLRGVAILMVLFFQLTQIDTANPLDRAVRNVLRNGWMGVDLFFVLSGFLITGILLDAKGSAHYFRNFYARRTLRIFPLYYGVLFVVFVLPALGAPWGCTWISDSAPYQAWLWLYGTNILQAQEGWVL